MISAKPTRITFSPALPCADCKRDTGQGLIYQMGSLVWQLLPLCDIHIEEPPGGAEPDSLGALRCSINEQLVKIQQLQRSKRHIGRAYVRLRSLHAHRKARRALRRQLNQAHRLQAEGMEVLP